MGDGPGLVIFVHNSEISPSQNLAMNEEDDRLAADELAASDAILIALAQRCGGIQPLLETFFSFLKRSSIYV